LRLHDVRIGPAACVSDNCCSWLPDYGEADAAGDSKGESKSDAAGGDDESGGEGESDGEGEGDEAEGEKGAGAGAAGDKDGDGKPKNAVVLHPVPEDKSQRTVVRDIVEFKRSMQLFPNFV
jgi:hypothetical protein